MLQNSFSVRAYVGLGSNLEQPVRQVQNALAALAIIPGTRVFAHSRLYRSLPQGPQDQPDFINAVAALDTNLSAPDLLHALQNIELQQGRIRSAEKWGPRTVDLDLLLYGSSTYRDNDLIVPHPHVHQRDFVLVPLLEITPEIEIPGLGKARELLKNCQTNGLICVNGC